MDQDCSAAFLEWSMAYAAMPMAILEKTPIKTKPQRLRSVIDYMDSCAFKGGVSYGPGWWFSNSRPQGEDHTRTGMTCIASYFVGAETKFRGEMVNFLKAYPDRMRDGHSCSTMAFVWSHLALNLFEPKAFAKSMQRNQWYIIMRNSYDGGFVNQPNDLSSTKAFQAPFGRSHILLL